MTSCWYWIFVSDTHFVNWKILSYMCSVRILWSGVFWKGHTRYRSLYHYSFFLVWSTKNILNEKIGNCIHMYLDVYWHRWHRKILASCPCLSCSVVLSIGSSIDTVPYSFDPSLRCQCEILLISIVPDNWNCLWNSSWAIHVCKLKSLFWNCCVCLELSVSCVHLPFLCLHE
jgi:hypothetical protein